MTARIGILPILLLAVAGVARAQPPDASAATKPIPIENRPYAIRAEVAFAAGVRLDGRGRQQLLDEWRVLVGRFVGAPWQIQVAISPDASLLQRPPAAWGEGLGEPAPDKVWGLVFEADADGYALHGREYDVATRRLGPRHYQAVSDPADAPRALLDLSLAIFAPLAEITDNVADKATLTVQGGLIEPASPLGRFAEPGTIFKPIRIFYNPKDDSIFKIDDVPWSYLLVESAEGQVARARVVSVFSAPLTTRTARRNKRVALGVKPGANPTPLKLVNHADQAPLAGYRLVAVPTSDAPPTPIGLTGRGGQVRIDPSRVSGLVRVQIIAGDVEPLTEFPLVPGEFDAERTLAVDPKPLTMEAHAEIAALGDQVVDVVARRSRIFALLKARSQGERWDEVEKLIKEFRALPAKPAFQARLDAIEKKVAERQEREKRLILTRTLDLRMAEVQALLDRYFDDEQLKPILEEMEEKKDQPAKAPASAK